MWVLGLIEIGLRDGDGDQTIKLPNKYVIKSITEKAYYQEPEPSCEHVGIRRGEMYDKCIGCGETWVHG